jgi:hypothetical protein
LIGSLFSTVASFLASRQLPSRLVLFPFGSFFIVHVCIETSWIPAWLLSIYNKFLHFDNKKKNILEKLNQRLAIWKASNLSPAERITLCNDPNSLWASVLRGELLYVKTEDWNQQIQAKKKESALWKAICKVWHGP